MARNNPIPDDLIRKTQELPAAERNGELGDDQADGESRGGKPASRPRAGRFRTIPPVKEGRGRKLTISDGVFERLDLAAKRRKPKTTMSALANDILDRNLPFFEVIQKERPPAAE
jgi:hypothetical protein